MKETYWGGILIPPFFSFCPKTTSCSCSDEHSLAERAAQCSPYLVRCVDTLFIRWAFPFNATLRPPEEGKRCDYNPRLWSRAARWRRSTESPEGSRVSLKHRLILIWDSHASHLPVKAFMRSGCMPAGGWSSELLQWILLFLCLIFDEFPLETHTCVGKRNPHCVFAEEKAAATHIIHTGQPGRV